MRRSSPPTPPPGTPADGSYLGSGVSTVRRGATDERLRERWVTTRGRQRFVGLISVLFAAMVSVEVFARDVPEDDATDAPTTRQAVEPPTPLILFDSVTDRRALDLPGDYETIGWVGDGSSYTEPRDGAALFARRLSSWRSIAGPGALITSGEEFREACNGIGDGAVQAVRLDAKLRTFKVGWRAGVWKYDVESSAVLAVAVKDLAANELTRFALAAESHANGASGVTVAAQVQVGKVAMTDIFEQLFESQELRGALAHAPVTPGGCSAIHYSGLHAFEVGESDSPAQAQPSSALTSSGSGFLIGSDGLLATNWHVVSGHANISIRIPSMGNTMLPAEVVASDTKNDLAILRVQSAGGKALPSNGPAFCITPSAEVRLGDSVFTLGFPLPEDLGVSVKLSAGVVGGLSSSEGDRTQLQVSAPIQPGNSGGGLWNNDGALVGVIVSTLNPIYILTKTEGSLPQGVNFAVRSEYLITLLSLLPNFDSALVRCTTSPRPFADVVQAIQPYVVQVVAH